jgi:tetratricopeptide (TPR) repeat protein
MEAFAADLQAVLQRRPIAARRLGAGLRLWRWCQRHRAAATAAAFLLAGGAAVPAVVAWREQRANLELAQANADIEQSLRTTLDALHAVLTRLGNERLRDVPLAEQLGIESLQDAVALYRELLPRHPQHALLRQRAAQGLVALAIALERVGREDQAIAIYREAAAVLGGDAMDLPPELLDGRAHAELNLANLHAKVGRRTESLAAADSAERDFDAAGRDPRFLAASLRGRGELRNARSLFLDRDRDAPAIETLLRESLQFAREQLALQPGDPEAAATEIRRLDNLATLLAQSRRFDEAGPLLEEALRKARALPETARIWPPAPARLGDVLETWGNMLLDRKDHRSLEALRECLQLREGVAAAHPANVELQVDLGAALSNLGRVLFQMSRDDEALPLFERAAAVQRAALARVPEHRRAREYLRRHLSLLGSCQAELGRREALVGTAAELGGFAGDTVAMRSAARLWLRAIELLAREQPPDREARAGQYARAAMDQLLAADALGWGTGSRLDEPLNAPGQQFPVFAALKQRVPARAAGGDTGGR